MPTVKFSAGCSVYFVLLSLGFKLGNTITKDVSGRILTPVNHALLLSISIRLLTLSLTRLEVALTKVLSIEDYFAVLAGKRLSKYMSHLSPSGGIISRLPNGALALLTAAEWEALSG